LDLRTLGSGLNLAELSIDDWFEKVALDFAARGDPRDSLVMDLQSEPMNSPI
jgi:hypothetical protein